MVAGEAKGFDFLIGSRLLGSKIVCRESQITPLLLELRRVENDRLAIAKWDGKLPTTAVGGSTQALLNLATSAVTTK